MDGTRGVVNREDTIILTAGWEVNTRGWGSGSRETRLEWAAVMGEVGR